MPASGVAPPYRPIDLRGASVALLASIFWGVNPVAIKIGLEDAPPFRLAALRFLVGGTVILNLYAVHTVVLAHFLIPGDRLTLRRLTGVVVAYAGIVVLFDRGFALGGPTMVGDAIMFGSALILAERTVYLARAVHHQEPVKLLLAQAVVGIAVFVILSALVEPAPTRWTGRLAGAIAFQGVVVTGFNSSSTCGCSSTIARARSRRSS